MKKMGFLFPVQHGRPKHYAELYKISPFRQETDAKQPCSTIILMTMKQGC